MKKKLIFLLLLTLLCFVVIAYCYVFATIESNKKYYFPQIKIYLKVYKPPFSKYGYVIFSKDSVLLFSGSIDFAKISKSETSWVSFIFNPFESNKIYVIDRWNNAQINQVNFSIEKISREDTTFFEQEFVAGANTHILKPPYFEISVEGFLQSVFYTDCGIEEYPIKAKPINYFSTDYLPLFCFFLITSIYNWRAGKLPSTQNAQHYGFGRGEKRLMINSLVK